MMNKTLLTLLVGVVIAFTQIWFFSNIVLYFTISLVLASILRPLTNYINQLHIYEFQVPRFIAVISSFAVLLTFVAFFIILFIPLVSEQIQVLAAINYEDLFLKLTTPIRSVEEFIIENHLAAKPEGFIVDHLRLNIITLFERINFNMLLNDLISFTGNIFVGVLAILFITFFLLFEQGLIRKQIIAIIPNQYFEVSIAALYKIERLLSNYLLGLMFQMLAIFSIASLGLSLIGIKYSLTIAVFAAFANLIPYAGPILGATFGIIVGVSTSNYLAETNDYLFLILKIGIVFGVVQIVDNIFLQPIIFSKSVKAHPLEIFVVIFAGATIAGIPGMVAAIPVYTILRVSFLELYEGYRLYHIFKTK
jgi:predicted PurR-regulated permease PerM